MKNAMVALAATLLVLLLAEVAMRVVGLYSPPPWPIEPRNADHYRADPVTGYRLWPSSRTCERYPLTGGPILELISNSDGFRSSRELGEPDARPRVLVLGDSFVFGSGVEEGERLTERIEQREPRWRVDNLGMTGFGVDLMLRALESLGGKARPDVVVLAVYTHDYVRVNPQYTGMGFVTPKFELANGKLRDVPYRPAVGLRRARLWQAMLRIQNALDPDYLRLNEALFERFRASTLALGAEPVTLFLPGRGAQADLARREHLRGWAQRAHVPHLDLTEPITTAGVEQAYIPDNVHWTRRGHEVAGAAIQAFLVETTALAGKSAGVAAGASAPPPWAVPRTRFCRDLRLEGAQR